MTWLGGEGKPEREGGGEPGPSTSENGGKVGEVGTSEGKARAPAGPGGALDGKNGAQTSETERKEQERTTVKKRLFLEFYERSYGSVAWTCKKIEISRECYRKWKMKDAEFAAAVAEIDKIEMESVEEQLKAGISSGDGAQIRFYLSRRHPKYKPKVTIIGGGDEETIEDIFDEAEGIKKPDHGDVSKKLHEPGGDREGADDSEQEG